MPKGVYPGIGTYKRTSGRGFASMDPVRQREIASMGGRAVDAAQRSFSQDRQLASTAGRKGGGSVAPGKRAFSQNRELAREAGRLGGRAVKPENRAWARDPTLARRAGRKGGVATRRGQS